MLDACGVGRVIVFGVSESCSAARAVRAALAVRDTARKLGFEVRAGIHTGECELVGDDLAGIAVHIAARVMATAETGEVITSGTVKDLVVGSGPEFACAGR